MGNESLVERLERARTRIAEHEYYKLWRYNILVVLFVCVNQRCRAPLSISFTQAYHLLATKLYLRLAGLTRCAALGKSGMERFYLASRVSDVRLDVVALFACLHDHRRLRDYDDPDHGARAASHALDLRGHYLDLDDEGYDLLMYAMIKHCDGDLHAPVTVQVCWGADRLDIGRARGEPDPERLCTDIARNPRSILSCHAGALQHVVKMAID